MNKIRVTQIKSTIGRPEKQKRTILAIGLTKINQTVEHKSTPQLLGMVKKVAHLLKVEEVK
tara:strand:- start:85 stop:267 length:183 start_codon:yes stop_codon:yes gene_type:complete